MNYKRRSSRDSATDRIVVVEQQHLHGSSTGESINTGVSSSTGVSRCNVSEWRSYTVGSRAASLSDLYPFDADCSHMGSPTAIKHPVPDRVKP